MSLYLGENLIAPNQSNAANKSLSNLDTTGQAVIDGKVNKSGDTMSGSLSIALPNGNPTLTFRNIPTGSSSWGGGLVQGYDTNNRYMGSIQLANQMNGKNSVYLTVCNPSNGQECGWFGMEADGNGNVSFTHPQIVSTYVNGTSWYRVWSDGWCEQGGLTATYNNNPITITLLKNYSNTNYSVQCTQTGGNTRGYSMGVTNKTTSNFGVYSGYCTNEGVSAQASNSQTCWFAYGYIN